MKIKLLLTTLIGFNIAAPIFAGMYANSYNDEYMQDQPKLRKTILRQMKDKLDELERTYHIKELSSIIAANIFLISVTMRMQEQLTSPKEFNLVKPDANFPGFEDVIGADQAKKEATFCLDYLKNKEEFLKIGAQPFKGCILHGLPGTGKTELARAFAKESNLPFLQIDGSSFNTMWRGSGTKQLKKLETAAKAAAKKHGGCIVYIDEIDNLIGRPNGSGFESDTNATTATFKAMLDGFNKQNPLTPIFWMGSTNNPGIVDPAIIRDGRMPLIEVTPPTLSDLEKIFERKLYHGKVKTEPGIDVKALAEEMYFDENKNPVNFTGANAAALINKAAMFAIQKGLKAITKPAIVNAIINTPRMIATPIVSTPINYNKGIGALVDSLSSETTPGISPLPTNTLITPEVAFSQCSFCKG